MTHDMNITAARALHAATTQGEWRTLADSYAPAEWFVVAGPGIFGQEQIAGPSEAMNENPDFDWITYAHNNWPAILDTIERQAREIEQQRAELAEYWRAACAIESVDDAVSTKGLTDLHEIRTGNSYSHIGPCVAEMLVQQRDEAMKEIERLTALVSEIEANQAAEALRKAIAAAEAEIEERRKPITREWLQSIGSKRVPDDLYPHSEGNDNEQIGRMILWEFNDTGVWHMRDADWFDIKTRGDVLDLLRVLGGAK